MARELRRDLEQSDARRGITPRRAARAQQPASGRRSPATRRSERGEARTVGARYVQRARVDKPRRLPHPRKANATARPDHLRRGSPLLDARALPNGPGLRVSTKPAVRRCVAPARILTLVSEAEGHGAVISRRAHVPGCQPSGGGLGEAKQRAGRAPRALSGRSAGSKKPPRER